MQKYHDEPKQYKGYLKSALIAPYGVTMPHTMLRFPTVKARTGLSRSTIYLRISRGTFPAPVSLGGRAVGWIEAEVHAWLTARIAQRRLIAPGERGSSHDPAQEVGPSMTPRHTTPAPGAAGAEDGYRARGRTPRPAEKGWST